MLIPFFKITGSKYNKGMVDFQKPVPSFPIKIDNIEKPKKIDNIFKINTENNFSNKLGTTNNGSLV